METGIPSAQKRIEPRVLRDTDHWSVLDKPARWHTVARRSAERADEGRAARDPDVESWLRARYESARVLDEAGIVHRLDFETSGCLLVAKDEAALVRWRLEFRSETSNVTKIYLALVGAGLPDEGTFDLYFTSRHKGSMKITVRETGEARHRGRCAWRMLKRGDAGDLIEVDLLGPGRRHQIRAGVAHLGCPLVGDELYGGRPAADGMALHAWKLIVDGMETIAPVPAGWPLRPAPIDRS